MVVGLPAKSTLDVSIFFTVFKSITIHGSYVGNRQDAIEAVEIAATGAVKCHYQTKKLADIAKYVCIAFVLFCLLIFSKVSMRNFLRVRLLVVLYCLS